MKRLLLTTLFTACAVVSAAGQNWTTVTASNITDQNQTKLASGQICFLGTDQNNVPINFGVGGGGQVLKRPVCATVTTGAIVGTFAVPNPANTSPSGVLYRITVKDTSTGQLVLQYITVAFTGTAFNLDNYIPSANVVAPPATGNVTGPLNVNGNFSVTGAASLASVAATIVTGAALGNATSPSTDLITKGPWVDVRSYNASGSSQGTNAACTSGSTAVTLSAAIDFANGQGIALYGCGTTSTLAAVTGQTATPTGAGATAYLYKVAGIDAAGGDGPASSATASVTNAAILTGTSYNTVSWTALAAAKAYAAYVSTNAGSTWALAGVAPNGATSFSDNGNQSSSSAGDNPFWAPLQPPTGDLGAPLITTISSGAGTTNLVLAASAATTQSAANATTYFGILQNQAQHDDTAAVIAAMDGATGKMLLFPKGSYNVTSALAHLHGNSSYVGLSGFGSSGPAASLTFHLLPIVANTTYLGSASSGDTSNVTIQGLNISARANPVPSGVTTTLIFPSPDDDDWLIKDNVLVGGDECNTCSAYTPWPGKIVNIELDSKTAGTFYNYIVHNTLDGADYDIVSGGNVYGQGGENNANFVTSNTFQSYPTTYIGAPNKSWANILLKQSTAFSVVDNTFNRPPTISVAESANIVFQTGTVAVPIIGNYFDQGASQPQILLDNYSSGTNSVAQLVGNWGLVKAHVSDQATGANASPFRIAGSDYQNNGYAQRIGTTSSFTEPKGLVGSLFAADYFREWDFSAGQAASRRWGCADDLYLNGDWACMTESAQGVGLDTPRIYVAPRGAVAFKGTPFASVNIAESNGAVGTMLPSDNWREWDFSAGQAASRRWGIATDILANGDFGVYTEAAQGGGLTLPRLYVSPAGAASFCSTCTLGFGGGAAMTTSSALMQQVGTLTTTAAASDVLTNALITVSSHCTLTATNAIAAGLTGVYDTPAAGSVTVFHSASANGTFAVACSVN